MRRRALDAARAHDARERRVRVAQGEPDLALRVADRLHDAAAAARARQPHRQRVHKHAHDRPQLGLVAHRVRQAHDHVIIAAQAPEQLGPHREQRAVHGGACHVAERDKRRRELGAEVHVDVLRGGGLHGGPRRIQRQPDERWRARELGGPPRHGVLVAASCVLPQSKLGVLHLGRRWRGRQPARHERGAVAGELPP